MQHPDRSEQRCRRHQHHSLSAKQHQSDGAARSAHLLLRLADFILRRVLDNEGGQLVAHVDVRGVATSLAFEEDALFPHFDDCLGIAAAVALHILLDEELENFRELLGIVSAVDDGGACLLVEVGLRAKLAAKVLEGICKARSSVWFRCDTCNVAKQCASNSGSSAYRQQVTFMRRCCSLHLRGCAEP